METQKITRLALLTALALMLHILETIIPIPVGIPGVKIGLANIVTLIILSLYSFKDALLVTLLRTFLGSLFSGAISTFFFSFAGGLLSVIVMFLLLRFGKKYFSLMAISIVGGLFHNLGQLAAAALIIENLRIFFYLPVLAISGIGAGLLVGIVTKMVLARITPE